MNGLCSVNCILIKCDNATLTFVNSIIFLYGKSVHKINDKKKEL